MGYPVDDPDAGPDERGELYVPPYGMGGYLSPIPHSRDEVMIAAWWTRLIAVLAAAIPLGVTAIPDRWIAFLGNPAVVDTGAFIVSSLLTLLIVPLMRRVRAGRRNHGRPCPPITDNDGRRRE